MIVDPALLPHELPAWAAVVPTGISVVVNGEDTGRDFVIVPRSAVPPGTPGLSTDPSKLGEGGQVDPAFLSILGALGPFGPIAGYVLVKVLASARARAHAKAAVASAAKLDIGKAFASLAKADGWAHSSPASARAFEASQPVS